jgi:hypothetical protein
MLRTALLGGAISAMLGVGVGLASWSDIQAATMAKAPQLQHERTLAWSETAIAEPEPVFAVADLRPAQVTPAAFTDWSWREAAPVPVATLSDQPWDHIRPDELVEPASAPAMSELEAQAPAPELALDLAPVQPETLAPEPVTYAALP